MKRWLKVLNQPNTMLRASFEEAETVLAEPPYAAWEDEG